MSSIDDPIDAFLTQYPERPKKVFGETALDLAGAVHWTFKVVNIIRARCFSDSDPLGGLRSLATAVKLRFESLEGQLKVQQDRIDGMMDSPEFKSATLLAARETQNGATELKIGEMASVLVRSLLPVSDGEYADNLTGFIRDVIDLTERDVQVLRVLGEVFADVVAIAPNLNAPNMFTEKMDALRSAIDQCMHRDDFYSHCERLRGFGLAIDVPRNPIRMSPDDYCYRPTRRGLTLLRLLGDASSSSRQVDSTAVGPQSQDGRKSGSFPSTTPLAGAARVIVAPVSRVTSENEYSLKGVDDLGVVIRLANGMPIRVPKADYLESKDEVSGKPKILLTRKYFQGYFPGYEQAKEFFLPR